MKRLVTTLVLALALAAALAGCAPPIDPRESEIASAMVRADEPLLRSRPDLVRGKYARMARTLYDYYRGSVPVFRADLADARTQLSATSFPADAPLPFSMGDAHPENFGILRASDGTAALEPNDLDGADRIPYHWDLRRLTIGLALGARLSNASDATAQAMAVAAEPAIVEAAVRAYATAIHELAAGAPIARVTTDEGSAIVADLFDRSAEGVVARGELDDLTVVMDGARRLRRGVIAPDEPESVLEELPEAAMLAVPSVVLMARTRMIAPPDAAFFTVLDAARVLGSGVASWPRVRALVLVRGPSDAIEDDVVLELKELADSGTPAIFPPFRPADDPADRVSLALGLDWARPDADPFWSTTESWVGMPVQLRSETDAHPTLRVRRFEDELGTPEELTALATVLGRLLARVTARSIDGEPSAAIAIDRAIARDVDVFVAEEVSVATRGADRVETDFELFRHALRTLGPSLGLVPSASDRPDPFRAALFGHPPPPEPFE